MVIKPQKTEESQSEAGSAPSKPRHNAPPSVLIDTRIVCDGNCTETQETPPVRRVDVARNGRLEVKA